MMGVSVSFGFCGLHIETPRLLVLDVPRVVSAQRVCHVSCMRFTTATSYIIKSGTGFMAVVEKARV